jgi:hypothetical protein
LQSRRCFHVRSVDLRNAAARAMTLHLHTKHSRVNIESRRHAPDDVASHRLQLAIAGADDASTPIAKPGPISYGCRPHPKSTPAHVTDYYVPLSAIFGTASIEQLLARIPLLGNCLSGGLEEAARQIGVRSWRETRNDHDVTVRGTAVWERS